MMIATLVAGLVVSQAPFVLAVGVNRANQPDLPALHYADDDAAAAAELFGAPPDRTFLLTTLDEESQERFAQLRARARPATLVQLRMAAGELASATARARDAGEQPVVIIWLVGHGAFARDGEPFVALEDGALTPRILDADVLTPLAAAHRVHVVMDACHAGAMVQWRAAVERASDEEVARQSFLSGPQRPGNVGLISAAAAHQKTYEWEELRAGIFSALTRAALRGAANADGDACVTYDEVAAYVSAALQGIPLPEARPRVVARAPRVDHGAPLSCDGWFVAGAPLQADLAALGPFHVEDARGVWLAGGRFERGHQPALWLPGSQPLTLRNDAGEWPLQAVSQGLQLSEAPVVDRTQSRGAVERAIQEGLFKVPYGPSYLHGYVAARPPSTESESRSTVATGAGGRSPLRAVAVLPPVGFAAVLSAVALAGGGVGAWQWSRYLATDLQRPAAEARLGALAGFSVAVVALGAAVLSLGVAAAIGAVWWWVG